MGSHFRVSRISFGLAAFFLMSLVLGGVSAGAEKVIFALDWIAYGKHAPFYVSLDKGYFKEAGLEVDIIRGSGSGDTVKVVNTGRVEYGFADTGPLIITRAQGAEPKMVAMVHHKSLHVIYALRGSGISRPKDLEGKTVGAVPGEATHALFPSLAVKNGVDQNKVKFINTAFAVKVPSLLAGKVDAVVSFVSDLPSYTKAAKGVGKEIVPILYSDFGVDIYSNGVLVTDRRLKERPNEVKGFVQAVLRGLAWSVENPDPATDIFVKYHGTVDRALAREHWDIAVDHLMTPETEKTGIGFMIREKMQYTIDLVAQGQPLPRVPTPEEISTNDFITKMVPKRPKASR